MDQVLLGVLEFKEAKRLRSLLAEQGISLLLVSNPQNCGGGSCSTSLEVFAMPEDLSKIQTFFESERSKLWEGLNIDPALLNEVFDSEKEIARCPACGFTFSTQFVECPDCGLGFQIS